MCAPTSRARADYLKIVTAERRACEIRLRAERRAGELLAAKEKAKGTAGLGRPPIGGRTTPPPKDQPTLRDMGISKQQSSDWQKLADGPRGGDHARRQKKPGRDCRPGKAGEFAS
jgi:hypothetical protein